MTHNSSASPPAVVCEFKAHHIFALAFRPVIVYSPSTIRREQQRDFVYLALPEDSR